MRQWMCGGDWKRFGNERPASGTAGDDDKNWFRLCSVLTSTSYPASASTSPFMSVEVGYS